MLYVSIYQIDTERDPHNLAFSNFGRMQTIQDRIRGNSDIDSSIYDKVYEGLLQAENLEDVYYIFNQKHPEGYKGRSLSVSDVVQVVEDNPFGSAFYFCDSFGFRKVDFDSSKARDLVHPPASKDGPFRLDARLGITMEVSQDELAVLKAGGSEAGDLLLKLIHSGRCELGSDTYFPGPWNEEYLDDDLDIPVPYAPLLPPAKEQPSLDERIQNSQTVFGDSKPVTPANAIEEER